MTTIVEFLTARLDEDEALAREASAFYDDDQTNGVPWNGHEGMDLNGHERYWIAPHLGVVNHVASGRHIGRHDPARVLREVEAKRAIVAQHEGVHECPSPRPWSLDGNTDHVTQEECWTLRNLASVYAEHPEYDPAWSVAT